MSSNYSVSLAGPAPWGFRLQGGKDFNMPLTISRLTDGGKAAKANISVGDVVLSIDGIATEGMNHLEAQNKIKACAGNLNLTLQKASSVPKPVVPKDEPQEIIKPVPITHPAPPTAPTSTAPNPAYNKTARPFGAGSSGGVGNVAAPVPKVASIPSASSAFTPAAPTHAPPPQPPFPLASSSSPSRISPNPTAKPSLGRAPFPGSSSSSSTSSSPGRVTASPSTPTPPQPSVYNTPINLYSNENACEVAMGQRRGLLESQGGAVQHNGAPRKPIVETDIEFYHVPSHGDASKKRLIEDTEDWHPRTGTSQSRSFRILAQITGTEHELERKDSDTEKKTNDFADEAKPTSHITSPVKTMTKSPASAPRNVNPSPGTAYKSPSAQGSGYFKSGPQVGHVAPSYGMVSNSNPRALPPERPIPQPHPKDEDSLVQRAEHMPAGTRTPMCAHCNMAIRGPFLVAMGKSWHPEEFNCAHCRTSLADIGFVEERGSVYCEHCYEEFFAPTCGRCQQKILGEVINALKQTWHVYCFLCSSCQQPIRSNTFHLEDGVPYCEADYYNLFGTSCHGCDFPIEAGDKFLEALGFTWHDTCFVCSVCCTSLEGQSFFSKKDKPLCKKHAHTVKI
ncbi:PDZ and LIM domain protein 5-like isoform X1 [Megalops cyprinoides]|uniref:PDZ and LIM domain protein 5-like isoform X1 n=1 Tax=Megalops cyprinoides TaxID=118141 RepID=UPI001864500C|nr:PDZ and LIM domain protein 5-like isoform X1 [Megalops cyprinoides]XP_036382415.1 PDZ and LIM domain protein 5-like isoform X1 [Megalops cyprinoides]